jgi:hypothetical protein
VRPWRQAAGAAVGLALGLLLAAPAPAQQVIPAPPDTAQAPSVEPDTIRPGVARPVPSGPEPPQLSASADSVLQLLRSLPGFTVTEYQGRSAEYRAETGVLRLLGEAAVTRAPDRLTADTIEFRDRDQMVTAIGNARVISDTQDITAERLAYDLERRRALATSARTQLSDAATWFVRGDNVILEGTSRLLGRHAHFTSCDLEIPHYHFESDRVMVIRDRILVARPARLYFGNVPVMVLPFVVQNLETGRRSGFLTPRFGINDIVRTSSGYTRQVSDLGFYWAMNQYMGARIATEWRSGAYTALMGVLDFNIRQQFLSGSVGLDRYWRADGRREFSLNTSSGWQPDERTQMSLAGRYASSSDLIRDVAYDPREATQDLYSTFSLSRRFDWGRASLGADRRQSIATGDVSMTLPSFSFSPSSFTLLRSSSPELARWFSDINVTPGSISGSRSTNRFADNARVRRQDQDVTRFRMGPSISFGNLTLNATGDLNRLELFQAAGLDREGQTVTLPAATRDEAGWSTQASYRQSLIGTTSLAPQISLSQQLVRDTLTGGAFLGAPTRMSFGAGLNTDLYGIFGGVGPFTAVRHRFSPRVSYSYSPEVVQTPVQERVFGRAGGRAQNRVSLDIGQTFEAKLRTPAPVEPDPVPRDTLAGDTIPMSRRPSVPSDPQKVTILSLTTTPVEYDFIKAREEGSGFVTTHVGNTIGSDYLRGLQIQMQHELFDRSELDPRAPENAGELGRFAPRLSSLSTSFELGPNTALIRWLDRLAFAPRDGQRERTGPVASMPESDDASPVGQGPATGNPQGTGAGPWNVGLAYQFARPPRTFTGGQLIDDQALQTINADMRFQLSPQWSVTWATHYSLTDAQFAGHRIGFRRDIHEWQANFNFYQTPYGSTAFEFYVELLHNRDIRFDYREHNIGVDRRR